MKKIRKLRMNLLEYVLGRCYDTQTELILSRYHNEIPEKEYNKYMKILNAISTEAMNRLVKLYG